MGTHQQEQRKRLSGDDEPERDATPSDRVGPHSPAIEDVGLTKTPSTSRGPLAASEGHRRPRPSRENPRAIEDPNPAIADDR